MVQIRRFTYAYSISIDRRPNNSPISDLGATTMIIVGVSQLTRLTHGA